MDKIINCITQINYSTHNVENMKDVISHNLLYKAKYNIDIFFNPPSVDHEETKNNGLIIYSDFKDLEKNILFLISKIPKSNSVYYLYFMNYGKKINSITMPDFETLMSKNVFVII